MVCDNKHLHIILVNASDSNKNQKFVALRYGKWPKYHENGMNHYDPLCEKPEEFKNVNFQNSLKYNLYLFPTLGDGTGQVL